MPQRNTSGNSSPFAECIVISWTQSSHASACPSPASSAACDRNASSGDISSAGSASKLFAALTSSSRFSTRVSPRSPFSFLKNSISPLAWITWSAWSLSSSPAVSRAIRSTRFRNPRTAVAARPPSSSLAIAPAARHIEQLFARAYARIDSTVLAPMPRVGLLTTRSKELSSSRFETSRRYARASLISARSKKRKPP
jgi:hypothetical protein